MTIRGGGGPRDDRPAGQERRPMARRLDGGAGQPAHGSTRERRAGTVTAYEIARRRPRAGVGGLLRFAVFLAVGAVLVLLLLGTVLRPLTRSLVVDSPTPTRGPLPAFVADSSARTSATP